MITKISNKTKFPCKDRFEEAKQTLIGLSMEDFLQVDNVYELTDFAQKLASTKTVIPFGFYCKLKDDNMLRYFRRNAYFKFFNKELAPYLKELYTFPPKEQTAFFQFANALGCFSKEYLIDENNQNTQSLLCHKASNLLARLLQSETLIIGGFSYLFGRISTDIDANQEFYKFLSAQSGKNNFINANILIKYSREHRDYFEKIMLNFDKAKRFKRTLNSRGQPVELPWETALNTYYNSRMYSGITKDTRKIAKIYGSRGIKEKTFNEACDIFEEAKLACVPHHILGKPLKEKNDGTKLFTYEFLDKHNPKNGILGLYCSCCATLASEFYGRDVTIASVLADDVQNVVIRDACGTIVGKGTLFVNIKKGYAVFNDFEIEYKYRSDYDNVWLEDKLTPNKIKCKEILETFLRAIRDFKIEYDEQHPEKTLKKVAVGIGYNKLKDLCEEKFQKAQPILKVPKQYCFRDADNHQYLLLGKNIKRKPKKSQQQDKEMMIVD